MEDWKMSAMWLRKKKTAQDGALLQDLAASQFPDDKAEILRQAGVLTYSRLLALIGDGNTEQVLRTELCWALWSAIRQVNVDKRQAAGPLIAALTSGGEELVGSAAIVVGIMGLKRAIPALTKLATDKSQSSRTRFSTIQALGMIGDARALAVHKAIVADTTEDVCLRGDALEQSQCYVDDDSLDYYIALLSDSNAELRFWAAYCIGQMRYQIDNAPALDAIDRVATSDHAFPTCWGWHIDREAILPLEEIYFRSLRRNSDETDFHPWIISPAAEYMTFVRTYRQWTETWVYTTDPVPPVTLQIHQSWLTEQLRQRWESVALYVRRPQPQDYLFVF